MSEVGLERVLGKKLQEARQAAGLTQQQMCHKAGLSYSTLAKIERGAIKAPSIFTIESIADTLGVSLDVLLGKATDHSPAVETKKTSKSGVRFIYFDINGCLVRFFHRAFTRLAQETGAASDVIETNFWHYNDAVCRGEMTLDAFNMALAKSIGIKSVDWKKYYLAEIDPIPEMQELIKWVAEHYYVGLVSNIMPGFIDSMLAEHLLPEVDYTAIVDSSEVGAIKPEKKIYEVAQGLTNCKPHEILLVDDSRANVMAGEKMGWHVLWFDDFRPQESAERVRAALQFE